MDTAQGTNLKAVVRLYLVLVSARPFVAQTAVRIEEPDLNQVITQVRVCKDNQWGCLGRGGTCNQEMPCPGARGKVPRRQK